MFKSKHKAGLNLMFNRNALVHGLNKWSLTLLEAYIDSQDKEACRLENELEKILRYVMARFKYKHPDQAERELRAYADGTNRKKLTNFYADIKFISPRYPELMTSAMKDSLPILLANERNDVEEFLPACEKLGKEYVRLANQHAEAKKNIKIARCILANKEVRNTLESKINLGLAS